MNIGIDARSLVEKKVGFGYFLTNMLEEMLQMDTLNTYYFFSDREIVFDFHKYKNVKTVQYKDSFFFPKSFYYYFRLAGFIKKSGIKLDVFWGTMHLMPKGFDSTVKKVLTIHDFTHRKFPKSTTKFNLLVSKLFFGPSLVNSDEVVCISNNTKQELLFYYPNECKNKRVSVIYEGGYSKKEIDKLSYNEELIRKEILDIKHQKYLLFVGTIEPRKNISLLIEAAPKLSDVVKIVVCGKIGWEKEELVAKMKSTSDIFYFDYITQNEKIFLMKNAFCQVQPSLYEGFGLPVVESMQAGSIVMVANNSSLKEIVEMEELRFETNDVNDFCLKIKNLLDKTKYEDAIRYCGKRGAFFDWHKAAQNYGSLFVEG